MPDSRNVYVIDDDTALRESLDFSLGSAGFQVTLFETATHFLASLSKLDFGCILSDVRMPGIDGISFLRQLRANPIAYPVIIMTGHGDIPLAVEAIKLGAIDFLEKPFEDEHLIGMIDAALHLRNELDTGDVRSQEIVSRVASLSHRERQVLEGLIAGNSNKLIAREYNISPRTVEVYRANVMTKMQASSLSELIRLALRTGLLKD